MSHKEQKDFLKSLKTLYPYYFNDKCVIEIGSLYINGTVREFFNDCTFIGIDVAPGPCVDVVCLGHEFDMPDNSFDVAISCECFEHDPYYLKTFTNMIRLVKPGGIIIFTCATTGRKEHGTLKHEPYSSPLTVGLGWDYYKNLEESDFADAFDLTNIFKEFNFSINKNNFDLYFYGIKN